LSYLESNLGGMQYFHPQVQVSQQGPPQHQQQQPQHGAYPSVPHGTAGGPSQPTLFTYASAPSARSPQQPSRDESPKHVTGSVYLPHGAPLHRGYVIQQTIDVRSNQIVAVVWRMTFISCDKMYMYVFSF
jgi:hypothetical protein